MTVWCRFSLSRSTLLDRVPGASSYVGAKGLLDKPHEYRSARAGDVGGEDLAATHGEDARAINFERERELRLVGLTQKSDDSFCVRWQAEGSVGVCLKQLA